ncbi:hypothetical protein NFI96_002009 [Prochilodus magdalenae]|nr:hypothetical protein NFI96_002009 [Prochilodus magdalenae]
MSSLRLVSAAPLADGCTTQDYMHTDRYHDCPQHHVTVTKDCSGVVPDCHGVTQNGSGSSSVTSPALVLVETPDESVCGGTVVSTEINSGRKHCGRAAVGDIGDPVSRGLDVPWIQSLQRVARTRLVYHSNALVSDEFSDLWSSVAVLLPLAGDASAQPSPELPEQTHRVASSGGVFSGVTNHPSPSGNPMDESEFGGCQENGTCLTAPSVEFGGGGIMVWGWCSGVGLRLLVPVRGTLNASADQETLDHSILPTLWGQFGDGPFLFQHDRTPVHRASSIKTRMSESGVEELDWPAQSPDLHPIEHLWDGLERRLRARPSRPTSVSDLTDELLEEWSEIPINTFQTLVERIPRGAEAGIAVKGGATSY